MLLAGRLILASRSPRRQAMLKDLGLSLEVIPSEGVEERHSGNIAECVLANATAKARGALKQLPPNGEQAWIVGADTLVAVDGKALGKPGDAKEAKAMLRALSGREHLVYSGFYVVNSQTGASGGQSVRSEVRFRLLSEAEINWYVRSGEPLDKAGAYGVQGLGAMFIERIEGSYTNVVGLPLCELISTLVKLGAVYFD